MSEYTQRTAGGAEGDERGRTRSSEEGGVAAGGGRSRTAVCKRATEYRFEGAGGVGDRTALGTRWRWEQGGARDRTGGKMALSVSEVFSFFR